MKFVSLFLLLLLILWADLAQAKRAYWGVVSTGTGTGALGHGFLLFKEDDETFFTADVYQYNITAQADPKNLGILTVDPRHIEFSLKVQKFYTINHFYTFSDNRSISLYELNLSDSEIEKLLRLLKIDLNNPLFSKQNHYGPTNNCVSRPIELLNQVVTQERRIEYIGDSGAVVSFSRGIGGAVGDPFLNRLPFYMAKTLEHHPISMGLVKFFDRKAIYQARFYGAAIQEIHSMTIRCQWAPQTEKSLSLLYALYINSQGQRDLQPVLKLASSCADSHEFLVRSLVDVYEAVEPESKEAGERAYALVNSAMIQGESK